MKKEIMDWDVCKKEHIREVTKDKDKIKSMIKLGDIRLARIIRKTLVDEETASLIAIDYYEIIKELLTSLLLKHGLKSDNHECLISFLKYKYPEYEYETQVIHQLKYIRNRVSYDGIFVKESYIKTNKFEFEHIIKLLKKLING